MEVLIIVVFSVSFASIPLLSLVAYYRAKCKSLAFELSHEKHVNTTENVVRLHSACGKCPECAELDRIMSIEDDYEKSTAIIQHVRSKIQKARGS